MNIGFFDNLLCERGTTVSLYDYAYFNEKILNNKSFIFYDKNMQSQNENDKVVDKFKKQFTVHGVDNFKEIDDDYIEKYNITHMYIIKYGVIDDRISKKAKNCIHSVFDCSQPHGDVYASVSPYVKHNNNRYPVVPHMVNLPNHDKNLRNKLNIPDNAIVFGGYGGKSSFGIYSVQKLVYEIAKNNKNIYFLFANFEISWMASLPNIILLDKIVDLDYKVSFINTCDAMLWARPDGETFGIAIAEFSTKNKPVIAAPIGALAHVHLLGNKGIWYHNMTELKNILLTFNPEIESKKDWNAYKENTPEKVMKIFQNVFLS